MSERRRNNERPVRWAQWFVLPLATAVAVLIGVDSLAIVRTFAAGQAAERKTVWDGIYTEEQAARGKNLYISACSECHMEELQGADLAPALKGEEFILRWTDSSMHDLFNTVSVTMPQSDPGSLKPQEYIDIVAYLLKGNKVPAGKEEAKPDVALLKGITITKQKTHE